MFRKAFDADMKATSFDANELPTEFTGYAAVFNNIDLGGDKIIPGAFMETLEKRYPKDGAGIPVYWNHNLDDPFANVGITVKAFEDGNGLRITAALDTETAWGKQTARLLKDGRVTQMSFSFDVLEGAFVDSDEGSYYELRKLDLFEVSIVPIGMNQATEILSVKSAMEAKASKAPEVSDPAPEPVEEKSDDEPNLARLETVARRSRLLDF